MPDVTIIGAGIIGTACAFELSRRGATVNILDTRAPGRGATQASAGVLAPFIEAAAETSLQRLCVAGLARYDEFMAAVTRDAHAPIEYQRTGTIEVALDEEEVEPLERTAETLRRMNVRHELLRGRAISTADPAITPDAIAALLVSDHGLVSAPALTAALVRAATSHGARVYEETSVSRIARTPHGRLEVTSSAGLLESDTVIVAAGCWSGSIEIAGAPPAPVRPIRGQLLHLAWKTSPLTRIIWGPHCYMVPWTNGTVLVGATVEEVGFVEDVTVAGIHGLMSAAMELVPDTARAGFKEARVGLRPASADTLPIIGPCPDVPGVLYATGHYRNGILLAPLTAEMIADCVLGSGRHPLLELTSPSRWSPDTTHPSSV